MNLINQDYIFLSYSHKDTITEYITSLDNLGYNVLYDEAMSVGADWELKARRYISSPKCKGVVVFLSTASAKSKAILRELEIAQRHNKPLFPLVLGGNSVSEVIKSSVPKGADENDIYISEEISSFFPPDMIYLTSSQFMDGAYQKKMINTFSSWGMPQKLKDAKIHSTYTSERKDEFSRLKQQQRLFLDFDKGVISKLIDEKKDRVYLLDIGCNDGDLVMNRVNEFDNVSVVGVDISLPAINRGNQKYPEEKFKGYCIDCLDDSFLDDMREIMDSQGIEGFDLVVCSMILLHLDDPYKCLKNVRKLLRSGGHIFIRDMDDGLAMSHPDPDNLVKNFNNYSRELSFTGNRTNGRDVYSFLTKCCYRDIKVIPHEITTVGQDPDFIDILYNVNFKFILAGLCQRFENNPENMEYKNSYDWGKKAFDDLEDLFHTPGYYYRMGTIVFVARR